ncbi:MAG: transposase [Actinomycetota bacterium]|nr:transposase [Actinomycetota bacterium]
MSIEDRLAEIIRAFHPDALSCAVNLNVDLDIMFCVLAQAPIAAVRARLPGYANAAPDTIQPRFLDTPADTISIRLERRAYTPVLPQADLPPDTTVPWWANRTLHYEITRTLPRTSCAEVGASGPVPSDRLTPMAGEEHTTIRTAIVAFPLSGADYRRAHDAHHLAAGPWNQAVDWVHAEWKAKHNPGKYDIRAFLTSFSREQRPLHAHTTEAIGYDLNEVIRTSRTNRKNGMKVRAPWRKKNYRPLSFSAGSGWRVRPDGTLGLSLGRGRPPIVGALPNVEDSATGEAVPVSRWGEIQLCWDKDNRRFSLHIPYKTERQGSDGEAVTAIDEGVINPMALATFLDDRTIDVTIINGREARAIKRQRNKAVGALQKKLSKTKNGSRKHRRLVAATKRVKGKARLTLRDFDHQVARKAANHVIEHRSGRLVVGDVRGIEQKTKQKRSIGRHGRQQLSQWSRGTQEHYLAENTGLEPEHLNESGSTKTCPACGARNRPTGRDYRCKNPDCGFTCHRDAVGAINILQKATHGDYVPIGPDVTIRVTYLRDEKRWSPDQRNTHRMVQCRKAITLSSAKNQASTETSCEPKLAISSSSSLEPDPLVAVA